MTIRADERSSVRCPGCGYASDGISPADASLAIRSFPRRFRELLVSDRAPDDALVSYRPSPQEWSVLEHVAHLADGLHVAAIRLARIRAAEHPRLGGEPGGMEKPPAEDHSNVDVVLARLREKADRLAGEIDGTEPEDWGRIGMRNRQAVSALEVVHEAVHEGAHHLREVERVLSQARHALGRPDPPPEEE